MLFYLLVLALLCLFWVLLSGFFTPFLLSAGLACALVVTWLVRRMHKASGHDEAPLSLRWGPMLSYLPWLLLEVIKSGWDVSLRILSPGAPRVSPTLKHFEPLQKTELGLAIHANSITLTPGTICIEVEPGHFYVHAVSREGAEALPGSEMDRRVRAIEGGQA